MMMGRWRECAPRRDEVAAVQRRASTSASVQTCCTLARKLTCAKRSVSLVLARLRCGMLRLGGCVLDQRVSALLRFGGTGSGSQKRRLRKVFAAKRASAKRAHDAAS